MTEYEPNQIFNSSISCWVNVCQGVYDLVHPDKDIWSLWTFEGIYSEALEDGENN